MRIIFFAKSHKRSGITSHITRGMQALGHDTTWINRHRLKRLVGKKLARWWIRRRVQKLDPELILIFTRDLELPMLKEFSARYRTAQFYDDCNVPLRDEVVEYGRSVGHFFITARGQVEVYRARGVEPVSYVSGGCDALDHYRVPPDPAFAGDVAFIGTPGPHGAQGQKDRVELMRKLSERFTVKIYGRGWQRYGLQVARENVYPKQYRSICASSKLMIGLDSQSDVDLYFSNRTWITMGCGGLLCTRYVPNLEEILEHGKHLLWWKDIDHCCEVVAEILAHPEQHEAIRSAGYEYAHREYSYTRMCERILAAVAGG